MNDTIALYLRDLIYLLKERHAELDSLSDLDEFRVGEKFAFYRVLEMMENQAVSFDIDLEAIGFNDYEKYTANKKKLDITSDDDGMP